MRTLPTLTTPTTLPQYFSTADGSLQGALDGVNTVFTTGVVLKQAMVHRNGLGLTYGVDYGAVGAFIVFPPDGVPQPGDTIEVEGFPGW